MGPVFCFQTTLRRTYDDAFLEDDDDEWVFDPALDRVMVGWGATANPPCSLTYNPLGHAAIGETYSTDTDLRLRCGNVGTLLWPIIWGKN